MGKPGEGEKELTLKERIAVCPIHNWANVDHYLHQSHVPRHLWPAFHELILLRGQYPVIPTDQQAADFSRAAYQLTMKLNSLEGQKLYMVFIDLIRQWIGCRMSMQ